MVINRLADNRFITYIVSSWQIKDPEEDANAAELAVADASVDAGAAAHAPPESGSEGRHSGSRLPCHFTKVIQILR